MKDSVQTFLRARHEETMLRVRAHAHAAARGAQAAGKACGERHPHALLGVSVVGGFLAHRLLVRPCAPGDGTPAGARSRLRPSRLVLSALRLLALERILV